MNTDTSSRPKDWGNILFLTFTPLLGGPILLWYTIHVGLSLWMPALFLVLYTMVGLSICAGYHRYFAHKSYECSTGVQYFYAIFGAMAAQNSILRWSAGHRRHHAHSDTDWDPYNINRGFWWAHIVWIFYPDPKRTETDTVKDLLKNPVVMWQHRWYKAILVVAGFGIPALVGALCGDVIAGLLWGGFLRIIFVHHSTFLVNSLAHSYGTRDYNEDDSACDNWAVALLTFGEGYHSFHHRFPADFRNGIRWWCWDPAKWFIRLLRMTGLASELRETAAPMIEAARMQVAVKRLSKRIELAEPTLGAEIQARIKRAREEFDHALALWRKQAEERRDGLHDSWKETRRNYRIRLKQARQEWRAVLRTLVRLPG